MHISSDDFYVSDSLVNMEEVRLYYHSKGSKLQLAVFCQYYASCKPTTTARVIQSQSYINLYLYGIMITEIKTTTVRVTQSSSYINLYLYGIMIYRN